MVRNAKTLERHELRARDGGIGAVEDLYFDDQSWQVRYFVVDTGSWLMDRKVLVAPAAIVSRSDDTRTFHTDLTQEQIRNSPKIDTDRPVSRQQESKLLQYYGWPLYWGGGSFGAGAYPVPLGSGLLARAATSPPAEPADRKEPSEQPVEEEPQGDPHLRSSREVRGYGIEASDGSIGHVDDLLVDDVSWTIRYLVVDTRNWWPGKKVIIAPSWINRVSWSEQMVHVDLPRARIKESPEYVPSDELTRDYAKRLHEHYGRPPDGAW